VGKSHLLFPPPYHLPSLCYLVFPPSLPPSVLQFPRRLSIPLFYFSLSRPLVKISPPKDYNEIRKLSSQGLLTPPIRGVNNDRDTPNIGPACPFRSLLRLDTPIPKNWQTALIKNLLNKALCKPLRKQLVDNCHLVPQTTVATVLVVTSVSLQNWLRGALKLEQNGSVSLLSYFYFGCRDAPDSRLLSEIRPEPDLETEDCKCSVVV